MTAQVHVEVPRARRYPVSFAIEYRPGNQRRWHSGVTQNVSASGVLFGEALSDRQLELGAPIDMHLIIPSEIQGHAPTRVLCVGHVIRIVDRDGDSQPRIIAATIARYRLVRGDVAVGVPDARRASGERDGHR
jgi:PilZ domain